MPRYIVAQFAIDDLVEIQKFVAADKPSAARRLREKLTRCFELLAKYPDLGTNERRFKLPLKSHIVRPYVVFYRPIQNGIEIVRVLHAARDIDEIFRECP